MLNPFEQWKEMIGIPTYDQASGSGTWHWCTNCNRYPSNPAKTEFHPVGQRPRGDLCNECRSKEREGTCR